MNGPKDRPARGGLYFVIKDLIAPSKAPKVELNPAAFGDPFVDQTQWTFLEPAGENFTSFRLVQPQPDLWIFKATQKARRFSLLFAAVGLIIILLSVNALLATPPAALADVMGALIIGAIFIAVSSYSLLTLERQTVFDFSAQEFRRQNSKRGMKWLGRECTLCKFTDIYALQILPGLFPVSNKMSWLFELNLVLKDGSRAHVVGHGGFNDIRADAAALAEALACPLWDCSTQVE